MTNGIVFHIIELYSIMVKFMSDKKNAIAAVATISLDAIILERNMVKIIPKNRTYSLETIKRLTGYNFSTIRKYADSELFTLDKANIVITDDTRLLEEKTKHYAEMLIKKLVFPSRYKHDEAIYNVGRLINNSYYSAEEKNFIDLMTDKLLEIINDNTIFKFISHKELLNFNLINKDGFNYVARDIFNSIIQNELHAGDSIMPFLNNSKLDKKDISEKLESSKEFDFFFNENAILKCDLETNINVLIKNFLNLTVYKINDILSRLILLLRINSKYSILTKDIIFNEFE